MINEPARSKLPADSPISISQAPSPTESPHPSVTFFQPIEEKPSEKTVSVIVSPDATEPRPSGSGIVRAFVRGSDLSGETMTETEKTKARKHVKFSDRCKVVLIPQAQEYTAAGIFLWYEAKDYRSPFQPRSATVVIN